MRYLVTGGAGFIGSHLVECLLEEGHLVTALDDFSSGEIGNLEHVISNKKFHLVRGSVLDASTRSRLKGPFDGIFHLAARVGIDEAVKHPVQTMYVNVRGTESMLQYALGHKAKILIASSSEVYGNVPSKKMRESENLLVCPPVTPRWSYAVSKIADEHAAFAYAQQYRLPVVVVRLFNIVGERQSGRYGMVVPRFITQARAGKNITVYGDGKQTRSFCYVKDAAGDLLHLMESKKTNGHIFNLGSQENVSINNLARKIIILTKSKSKVSHISYMEKYNFPFADVRDRKPDLTKIKKFINVTKKISVDDIIKKLI